MFPLNMSDIKAANALETPTTSAEPNQAAPVIPTQDVKPAGSGEVSEIEAYQAERAALLAAPDQPEVPAPAVTPPTPAPVVPAEPPPVEGELEVGDPPAGELPPEPGKPPRYRLKPVDAIEAVAPISEITKPIRLCPFFGKDESDVSPIRRNRRQR